TYTETRTWDANDACGNHSATVSQTIVVRDITAPTIGGQGANATIDCPATPSFTAPTASYACNAITVNLLSDVTYATFFRSYTETRTWDANDACGNHSATVSQTIVVRDITAPTSGGQGANATIDCPATPSCTAPTASDACNAITVNLLSDVTTAGCGNTYTETRTSDANDACRNHSPTVSPRRSFKHTPAPTIGNDGSDGTIDCPATPSFTAPTASDACNAI